MRLHIDEVCPKSSIYPLVINFLNGSPTENFGTYDCLLYDNTKTNSTTVATKIDGMLYTGDEENNDLVKTFVVRRNKKTGKVRVLDAGIVNLKPIIASKTTEPAPITVSAQLDLSRKFGSKKQKKIMEHHEKLKVNIETVTQQMKAITEEVSEDTLDLSIYNKSDSDDFYIPPIDRNAAKASDVYDIDNILKEEEYAKIAAELEDKKYIEDLLPFIQSIVTNKNLSQKQLVLAVYANYLLNLYNTMATRLGNKKFCLCPYSGTLNNIIMENFTTTSNNRRVRPGPYRDRALCFAIVFLLLINDLKFELESLCGVIKLSPNTLVLKTKVTGASVVTVGDKKVAHLKLPLVSGSKVFSRRKSAKF